MCSRAVGVARSQGPSVAKGASGLFNGTRGNPQTKIDLDAEGATATYAPSPKHEPGYGWGSENPIVSIAEGQRLLDSGYVSGRQVFNVTEDWEIVKFQPDGTPQNGYHAYKVTGPRDIPATVLRRMYKDGKITRSTYNKLRKGKS